MTVYLRGRSGPQTLDSPSGYLLSLAGKRPGISRGGAGSSFSAMSASSELTGMRIRLERAFAGSAGGKV